MNLFKKKTTFKRGVHPPSNKRTADCAIESFPMPKRVYVPLSQHIGAPCETIVEEGQRVVCGQLIGEAKAYVCSNVFSPVSGTVVGTEYRITAGGGKVLHIVIDNDGLYERVRMSPLTEEATAEEIKQRLRDAGIVGMGGATFPTFVKLNPSKAVDTLIINAAECEPYITCDYRMLLEHTEEIVVGASLMKKSLGVERLVIALEDNKKSVVPLLTKYAEGIAEVVLLKTKYPQGAEKQLIYAITGRVVPSGGLPQDVACVVNNVSTAYAAWRASKKGEPLFERIMTVDGDAVEKRGNFLVGGGVTYQNIYDYCRGSVDEDKLFKVVSGGPMMGFAQGDLQAVTTKGTSSILFLTKEQVNTQPSSACINCANCAKVCPMMLMPMFIDSCIINGDIDGAKKYGAMECIECGSCAYACPAKRNLVQSCRLAKKKIKESAKP